MLKSFFIVLALFLPFLSFAHQAEISTTMLVEKDGKWLVQVNSALSALEHEVKYQFGDSAYKTPEEFQLLVAQMMQERLSVSFDDQAVLFSDAQVKLGHESTVVMLMNNVPENYSIMRITNQLFSNISKSRSALVVLKEGLGIERFELNDANDHSVKLQVNESNFELIANSSSNADAYLYTILAVLMLVLGAVLFHFRRKSKAEAEMPLATAK